MNMTCIIVEDTGIEAELLTAYISRIDFLHLKGIFSKALDAQKYIQNHDIDLVISDIKLPDMSGLEMIRTLVKAPQVIFTTSFPGFAIEGFDLEATDYIMKPLTFERFLTAINKAGHRHRMNLLHSSNTRLDNADVDHFFIRSDFSFVKIHFSDILYIESVKDYVRVVTTINSHITSITMKNIEEQIPFRDFIRIHRSYIVNVNKIEALKNDELTVGKNVLPVSESYKENLFRTVIGTKIIKK